MLEPGDQSVPVYVLVILFIGMAPLVLGVRLCLTPTPQTSRVAAPLVQWLDAGTTEGTVQQTVSVQ